MKIHVWAENMAPDFARMVDGSLVFYDHPDLHNFVVGDHIQYKTRLGVTVFEVIFIEPANLRDYDPNLQRITAKKLD